MKDITLPNMTNPQLALFLAINDKYYGVDGPQDRIKRAAVYLEWLNEQDKIK